MDSKQITFGIDEPEMSQHHFFSKSLSFAELGVTSERDTNEDANEINALASTDLNCNLHSSTDGEFITKVWEGGTNRGDSFDMQLSATYPFNSNISPLSHIIIGKTSSPEYHLNNINCNINRFLTSGTSTRKRKSLSADSDSLNLKEQTTKKDSPTRSWSSSSVVNSAEKRTNDHKTPSKHKGPKCDEAREAGPPSQGSATSTLSQSYTAYCGTMTSNSIGSRSSQVNTMVNQKCMSVSGQKHATTKDTAAGLLPKPKSLSNFALCSTSPQVIDHQSWLLGSIPSERHFSSVWSNRVSQRDSGKNSIGRAAMALSSSDGDSKCAKPRWGADETRRPRKKTVCPPKTKEKAPQSIKRRHLNTSSFNSFIPSEDELQRPRAKQQKRVTSTPFLDTKSTRPIYGSTQSADDSAAPFSKVRSSSELPVKKRQDPKWSVRLDSFAQTKARKNRNEPESQEFRRRPLSSKTQRPACGTKVRSDGDSEERHDQRNAKSGAQYKWSSGRETSKEFETNRGKIQRKKIEKPVKRFKKKKPKGEDYSHDQDMDCSADSSCVGLSDIFNSIKTKHTKALFSSLESSPRDDLVASKSCLVHQKTLSPIESGLIPLSDLDSSRVKQRSITNSKMSLSTRSDTMVDAGSHKHYAEGGCEDWQRFHAEHSIHPSENRLEETAVEEKPLRKRKKKTSNQTRCKTNPLDCPSGGPYSGQEIKKQGSFSRNTLLESKTSSSKRKLGQQSKSSSAKLLSGTNAKAKKNQTLTSRATSSEVNGKPPERKISPKKPKLSYLKNPGPRRSSQPEKTKNPSFTNENLQQLPVSRPRPSFNSAKNVNPRTEKVCRRQVEISPSLSQCKNNADIHVVKRNAQSASCSTSKKPLRTMKVNNEERNYAETRKTPRIDSETRSTQPNFSSAAQAKPMRTYGYRADDRTPSVTENFIKGSEVDDRRHNLEPRPSSPMKRGVVLRQGVPSTPLESPLLRKCNLSPSKAKMELRRSAVAGPSTSRGVETTGKVTPKKLKYASRYREAESTSSCSAANDNSSSQRKKSGSTMSTNLKLLDYQSSQEREELAGGDQGASGSSGGVSSSFMSTKSLTTVKLEQFKSIWHRHNTIQASSVASSKVYVSSNSYLIPLRNLAWNGSRDRPSFAEEPAKEAKETETHSQRIEYGIIFVMLVIQILLHYFVSSQ